MARTMRASSLRAHGCALNEPRSALANSEGRMPGERAAWGVLSLVTFFAQAKKVTRSPAGRVEALHFQRRSKYSRLRGNDVKRKELDSGFRRNDEQKCFRQ